MTRIWPDTLPGIIKTGFSLRPLEQSLRTDMEAGARRLRRISASRGDSLRLSWKMTDAQMAAFRAWHGDEAWSLAGASDDVAGWNKLGATVEAGGLAGPALQAALKLVEDTATGVHRMQQPLPTVLDDQQVQLSATLRRAGRTAARLGLYDRAGVFRSVDIDLETGALSNLSGIGHVETVDRRGGWWRVTLTASAGLGVGDPAFRIVMMDGTGAVSYAGDGSSAIRVCEVNARLVTGYDLYLPTDAAGHALGAAGGSGWFNMAVPLGGGYGSVECRFEAPFEAQALDGFNWQISGQVEVRHA